MKIYLGNLPFDATEADIRALFEPHGTLNSVDLVTDSATGRFRGFAFLEMLDADAAKAIAAVNGTDMHGRTLNVNEARPKTGGGGGGGGFRDRGGRGGNSGRGGGGGGRGRY